MSPVSLRIFAPAKINLTLAVTGRRADGYHDLESLVVFADEGDWITLTPKNEPGRRTLTLSGPFADALRQEVGDAQSLSPLTAASAMAKLARRTSDGLALHLEKRLPIASGIGGGSADAAAVLRGLNQLWALDWPLGALAAIAGKACGADAPACVTSRPLVMRGLGDVVAPLAAWPALPAVLVNPGTAVSTAQIFKTLAARGGAYASPEPVLYHAETLPEALQVIAAGANDLTNVAVTIAPEIADVLAELTAAKGCRLSRMSGSGATCFGLFDDALMAEKAAARIAAARPGWWVRAGILRGAQDSI